MKKDLIFRFFTITELLITKIIIISQKNKIRKIVKDLGTRPEIIRFCLIIKIFNGQRYHDLKILENKKYKIIDSISTLAIPYTPNSMKNLL